MWRYNQLPFFTEIKQGNSQLFNYYVLLSVNNSISKPCRWAINRVDTVREKSGKIRFHSRSVKIKSGCFVSGQGISKSLFNVRSFILRLPQIILLDLFMKIKQFCFKNYLSETSLYLLICSQSKHPARSVRIASQLVIRRKSQGLFLFVLVGGDPDQSINQ